MSITLDASGISDPKEIRKMLKILKVRALEHGPYSKYQYRKMSEIFAMTIQEMHTIHNAFGCAFTLTKDEIGKDIYFRFAMSRVSAAVLANLSQDQFKCTPFYKGVISRSEFFEWCIYVFGSDILESSDFKIITQHTRNRPKIGDMYLEMQDNDARHRWECVVSESRGIDVH